MQCLKLWLVLLAALILCVHSQLLTETPQPTELGTVHSFLGDDNAPKYEVVIQQDTTAKELLLTQRDRLFPMNFNGEPFLCHVPIAQQQRTEKPEQKLASKEDAINRIFLLDNVCHYRYTGWWIYELCTNNHVRQFHQEQGKGITMEFFLGYLGKKNNVPGEQHTSQQRKDMLASSYSLHVNENSPDESHVSVQYVDGTACDLSKQPRRVEVRYFCPTDEKIALYSKQQQQQDPTRQSSDKNAHFIESIEEPSSCNYVLKFATTGLCDIAGFVKRESQSTKVKCLRLVDEANEGNKDTTSQSFSSAQKSDTTTTTVIVEPKAGITPIDAQQQTAPQSEKQQTTDVPEKQQTIAPSEKQPSQEQHHDDKK